MVLLYIIHFYTTGGPQIWNNLHLASKLFGFRTIWYILANPPPPKKKTKTKSESDIKG